MKKFVAAVVAASLLAGTCSAGAVSVSDVIEERDGGTVSFAGRAENAEGKLMVKVYNTKYGEDDTSGFVKLDTVTPEEDGSFEFSVVIPDTLGDGSNSTGEYEFVLSDGVSSARRTFLYMNTEEAEGVFAVLESEDSDSIYVRMDGEFADSAAMTGIDIEAYKALSETQRRTVCEWFASNRNGSGTAALFNKCIYSLYITVCPENERVLTAQKLAPEYGGKAFAGLSEEEKAKTAAHMAENAPESFDEVSEIFGTALALSALSTARKDDVYNILTNNAVLLELSGTASYEDYLSLTAADRQKTNEKFVAALGGKMASVSEIADILSSSITKTTSNNTSTGGGSQSTGSGGSGIIAPENTGAKATPSPSGPTETPGHTTGFSDLESVTWAAEAIEALAEMNIVNGVGNGEYDPNASVTREAFVKMLLLASGLFEEGHTSAFGDVDASEWYAAYVGCAADKGIVNGISETEFGIGRTITRQDMAVMIKRAADAAGVEIADVRSYDGFGDSADIADYAAEAVERLYCAGIINGRDNGLFEPASQLTRAEAAKVIYDAFVTDKSTAVSNPSSSNTPAQASETERILEFMTAVGIASAEDAPLSATADMTAGRFINMALSLAQKKLYAGDTLSSEARSLAESYAMLPEGISESGTLTVAEAAQILVSAAGYSSIVSGDEIWPQASMLGILDGVSQPSSETLSVQDALRMIRNAADCTPAVVEYSGTTPVINILNGTTLLEKAKNIYKRRGTVTGNGITTLYSADGLAGGRIEIDNTEYVCDNDKYGEYLGYYVTYYVQSDDSGDILKYAEPVGDNETTVISAKAFESVSDDFRTVYYTENGRKRTADISASPNVIYNGRYCGDYTADDFNIDAGDITIIKARASDGTDTVIINSYETFIFDRMSSDRLKIFGKYSHTGATTEINLNNAKYTITKNGAEIQPTELKEWDVLSVAAARGGFEPYYTILVSDTREEALTESYSYSDMTVTSIGYIYDIAKSYYDSFAENKGVGVPLELGERQIYLLDSFGRVAAVLGDESAQTDDYMYVVNAWINEDGESAGIKYYDMARGEMVTANIAARANVGGESYTGGNIVNSALFDADGNAVLQLVKLTADEDGNVNRVETAVNSTGTNTSEFTRTRVSTSWIYENSSFNYEAFLTADAQILCVPDTGNDADDFYVLDRSMFENDQAKNLSTSVTAYNMDEFKRTPMVVVNYSNTSSPDLSDTQNIFVIDKVSEAVNGDGETARLLHGSIGNYEGMEFYINDATLVPNAAPGDALYVSFDKLGNIRGAEIIFSLNELLASGDIYENAKTTRDTTSRNSRTQLLTGWIEDVDLNAGANENMVMLDGTSMLPIRLNGLSSKAVVYDAAARVSTVQDISAIEPGDLMIVRLRYSSVRAIAVIKNIDEAGV